MNERIVGAEAFPKEGSALVIAMVLILGLGMTAVLAYAVVHREHILQTRGLSAVAQVVATTGSAAMSVRFESSGCGCPITTQVQLAHPARHPIGSTLPVRYDPRDPERAEALQDRFNPYRLPFGFLGFIVFVAALIAAKWLTARRRKRKVMTLVHTAAPINRVRVEAWRGTQGNQEAAFLSLYPEAVPQGGAPLMVFPTRASVVRALNAAESYELYQPARRVASAVLRGGDLVVVLVGKERPPAWEVGHRLPWSQLALGVGKPSDPLLPAGLGGPALLDTAAAVRYRRMTSTAIVLGPVLGLFPILL
jgi:hypothetical protein